jgi:hypothetical protein
MEFSFIQYFPHGNNLWVIPSTHSKEDFQKAASLFIDCERGATYDIDHVLFSGGELGKHSEISTEG